MQTPRGVAANSRSIPSHTADPLYCPSTGLTYLRWSGRNKYRWHLRSGCPLDFYNGIVMFSVFAFNSFPNDS